MNPIEVPIAHEERHAGQSKYSLYSLIRLNFDLITGFSVVPLQLFSMVGMAMSALSALLVIVLFVRRLFIGSEAEGRVHAVRPGVLLHRPGAVRHRPAGRVRRPHLCAGARAAALHRRGGARGERRRGASAGHRANGSRPWMPSRTFGGDPRGGVRLQRSRGALRARTVGAGCGDPAALHSCRRSEGEPLVRQRARSWPRRIGLKVETPDDPNTPRVDRRGPARATGFRVLLLLPPHARIPRGWTCRSAAR